MSAAIIIIAFVFCTIFFAAGNLIACKVLDTERLWFAPHKTITRTLKLIVGALILIGIYLYCFIDNISVLTSMYNRSWTSNSDSLGLAFAQIISLCLIIMSLLTGIWMLSRLSLFIVVSSVLIIGFEIIYSLFFIDASLIYSYFSLLPDVLILLTLIYILIQDGEIRDFFARNIKIFRLVPFVSLFKVIGVLTSYFLNSSDAFPTLDFVFEIAKAVAFWLILSELINSLSETQDMSFKVNEGSLAEKIVLGVSALVFPLIIYLASSISSVWLFAGSVVFGILITIALLATKGLSTKVRLIVIAGIFAFVIGICLIAKATPKNEEKFDSTKCYWCEGYGFYITDSGSTKVCSKCHGSGKRAN